MFKKINLLLIVILLLTTSCGTWDSVKRGLTNQKKKLTDEFLVKKKDPLILPPDYETLPTPGERSLAENEQSKFEELVIGNTNIDTQEEGEASGSNSIEENILKKIRNR